MSVRTFFPALRIENAAAGALGGRTTSRRWARLASSAAFWTSDATGSDACSCACRARQGEYAQAAPDHWHCPKKQDPVKFLQQSVSKVQIPPVGTQVAVGVAEVLVGVNSGCPVPITRSGPPHPAAAIQMMKTRHAAARPSRIRILPCLNCFARKRNRSVGMRRGKAARLTIQPLGPQTVGLRRRRSFPASLATAVECSERRRARGPGSRTRTRRRTRARWVRSGLRACGHRP